MSDIWLNGVLLPDDRATVSIYDSAMMYGDSVFEMLRTFNGRHFKVDEHLARLQNSAWTLGLPIPEALPQLDGLLCYENFRSDDETRTLITIGRGILPLYEPLFGQPEPWLMICQYPLRWVIAGKSHLYRDGVHAIESSVRQIPGNCIPSHIKHHNRIHFRLAEMEVQRQDPDAWALVLDQNGCIAEATGANLFIVRHGYLMTPGKNCLPGISRNFVLDLARSLGITTLDYITPSMLRKADEAFFTCTPYSIVPCTRFNGAPIGDGKVGSITHSLTRAWCELVDCDFVAQAEKWDAERSKSN